MAATSIELCQLCESRKPRRTCPGVRGEICSQCCGREREETVDCPFDCGYLLEARKHEKVAELKAGEVPNTDIKVSEEFLEEHENLLVGLGGALCRAAIEVGAVDSDLRECLEATIRTFRTRESGLYYETKPVGGFAAAVQQNFIALIDEYRQETTRQAGLTTIRDADVLGILVFLQRIGLHLNNGRRRGRSFSDYLRLRFAFPDSAKQPASSPLIL